jgi:hypothetical protein
MEDKHLWRTALKRGVISGSMASLASAIALAMLGKAEIDNPVAPINGPSQWIWGRFAPYRNRFTARHTVIGYLIHHAASVFWASLYERWRGANSCVNDSASVVAQQAAAISAVALFVDYRLTPKRLTPGFEKRLSRRSLFAVYAAFALGLAIGTKLNDRLGT